MWLFCLQWASLIGNTMYLIWFVYIEYILLSIEDIHFRRPYDTMATSFSTNNPFVRCGWNLRGLFCLICVTVYLILVVPQGWNIRRLFFIICGTAYLVLIEFQGWNLRWLFCLILGTIYLILVVVRGWTSKGCYVLFVEPST